jgi:hypothetical protein
MASRTAFPGKTGPEWVMVQLQIRVPYWRRMQLQDIARDNGVTIAAIIGDAVDRTYPPEPPK